MTIARWVLVSFTCSFVLLGCSDDTAELPDAGTVCIDDAMCDDGIYCNGAETCAPDIAVAAPNGCVQGSRPCADGEMCLEEAERCDPDMDCDVDGDGEDSLACGGTDCDDEDSSTFPGNTEVCDSAGHDEDCDPTTYGGDSDGDGYEPLACCNGAACGADCDDDRAGVNPGASDGCGGGDQDCDGSIDEEPDTAYFRDADEDNYGDPGDMVLACAPPDGYVDRGDDCDDDASDDGGGPAAFDVHPGVAEPCDSVDNDCDGTVDEQPLTQPICCPTGMSDCDGDRLDCEAAVDTDRDNCGLCGSMCPADPTGGQYMCLSGGCGLVCDTGLTDCGGSCVDLSTDPTHCGTCGTPCGYANGTGGCSGSACFLAACDSTHGDCNASESDGCETPIGTSLNCTGCGDICSTGENCTPTGCVPNLAHAPAPELVPAELAARAPRIDSSVGWIVPEGRTNAAISRGGRAPQRARARHSSAPPAPINADC